MCDNQHQPNPANTVDSPEPMTRTTMALAMPLSPQLADLFAAFAIVTRAQAAQVLSRLSEDAELRAAYDIDQSMLEAARRHLSPFMARESAAPGPWAEIPGGIPLHGDDAHSTGHRKAVPSSARLGEQSVSDKHEPEGEE